MTVKYFEGTGPLALPVVSIFAAVKSIIETGNEIEFVKGCEKQGFTLSADIKLINFAKKFLSESEQSQSALESAADNTLSLRVQRCDDTFGC